MPETQALSSGMPRYFGIRPGDVGDSGLAAWFLAWLFFGDLVAGSRVRDYALAAALAACARTGRACPIARMSGIG